MNLQEELKRINEFFENMSIEEFDTMLIKNGVEDYKYKFNSKIIPSYMKYKNEKE